MKSSVRAAIASVAFILTSAAIAETDLSELIQKWGLVGKWSTDCSPEAAPHGVVAYEIEPDGRATIDSGASLIEMRIAMINSDGDLTLHTIAPSGGETRVLMLLRSGDSLQPITIGRERNDYTVRNGKFVASFKETSPLRRCNNESPTQGGLQ
jgi:hypothetical protein